MVKTKTGKSGKKRKEKGAAPAPGNNVSFWLTLVALLGIVSLLRTQLSRATYLPADFDVASARAGVQVRSAAFARGHPWPKEADIPGEATLDFLIVGDWGVDGPAARAVGAAMDEYALRNDVAAVVSTGDQLYPNGLESADHMAPLTELFQGAFGGVGLRTPWFVTAGNHDCRGSVEAMTAFQAVDDRWHYPSRWYTADVSLQGADRAGPRVRFVVLDTCNLACNEEQSVADEATECSRLNARVLSRSDRDDQLLWLGDVLANAAADQGVVWTVLVGHHPLASNGPHGNSPGLQRTLVDVIERAAPGVEKLPIVYLSGHDHTLEHIVLEGDAECAWLHQVVSGSGGYGLHGLDEPSAANSESTVYSQGVHGFVAATATLSRLTLSFIAVTGEETHAVTLNRPPSNCLRQAAA